MTRAEYETFVTDFHHLCLDIGIRPASRAMGISEDRGRKIAQRRKFHISQIRPLGNGHTAQIVPPVTGGIEAKRKVLALHSDRTKIGLAIAGSKVAEHLADKEPKALIAPATAIAAQQWSKVGDVVHGWQSERTQGTVVNVANVIPMPTEEERAERRAIDAKLDAIAKRLTTPR